VALQTVRCGLRSLIKTSCRRVVTETSERGGEGLDHLAAGGEEATGADNHLLPDRVVHRSRDESARNVPVADVGMYDADDVLLHLKPELPRFRLRLRIGRPVVIRMLVFARDPAVVAPAAAGNVWSVPQNTVTIAPA